jgi:hypothetical protein
LALLLLQVNLTFLVQDTKNGSATLSPNIQLCRCVNGECFVPEATSEQEAAIENTFLVMSCNCPFGYTGEFCGEVRDFCAGELTPPCNPLVTCANSAAGFMCGDCPNGYEGNGQICSGQLINQLWKYQIMNRPSTPSISSLPQYHMWH